MVYKTIALPLSYVGILGWAARLELVASRFTAGCSNQLSYAHHMLSNWRKTRDSNSETLTGADFRNQWIKPLS